MGNDKTEMKLERFLSMMDGGAMTKEEFVQAFEQVVDVIKEFRETNAREFDLMKQVIEAFGNNLDGKSNKAIDDLKKGLNELFVDERVGGIEKKINEVIDRKIRAIDDRMGKVRDGSKGDKGDQGRPGRDGSPDSPAKIKEKLESLEGDNRLDASAIKGLDDMIKKGRPMGVAYAAGTRGTVKIYDLSSLLDGTTKTFSLPAFVRVLTVDVSSFPNAMRPTVDFTTDGAAMTITFTSQIDAPTTLAAGQTCIVTYAEA